MIMLKVGGRDLFTFVASGTLLTDINSNGGDVRPKIRSLDAVEALRLVLHHLSELYCDYARSLHSLRYRCLSDFSGSTSAN